MSVHKFNSPKKTTPIDPPSGGGDNSDMETRVAKLEDFAIDTRDRLTRIESRLELEMATKTGLHFLEVALHKEFNSQTWKFITWMTGICTALIAATYFIAKH